ncbi:EamA family transporter [Gordonia jinghuaiqii]|uniref:EamA family transporter n=1 Tax=Gordonia jinghuaiqii TaxID=2758710 RepID=A0A7D7LS00_9ACTN|nr:EamA family transporter [Gordonia jinghuaiqii]MCR5980266.1 EamA family transporter [Gordonia jinghuaiqii]QMT01983.1 EamA family transporter [Gordonia jinghuaiqii]
MSTRDRCLALFVVVLWGLNFIAIRLGLDHFPPFFLAALRFAIMAVPVVLFVRFPKVRLKWFLLYVTGFGTVQFMMLFLAMELGMPTGLASLVLQTSAPFTVVLGVLFLRERMTFGQVVGLCIAVGGMALIAVDRARGSDLGGAALVPIGLTILGGLSWAAGNIGGRLARPDDPLRMTLWMSVVATPPLYAASLIIEGPAAGFESLATLGTEPGLRALGGLLYLAIFGTLIGAGIWTALLSRNDASRVSPMSLLVPVVGISAAFAFLGEVPTTGEIVGAVIVVAGCAAGVMARPRRRTRRHDENPAPTAENNANRLAAAGARSRSVRE